MCTLTIIPSSGIRLVCNRDESRLRSTALPPRVRIVGSRQAVMPVDPVSDGTWIGASDAGVVAVLMNYYARPLDARVSNRETRCDEVQTSCKTAGERGTVPFCSADYAKSGQSPTVLKPVLVSRGTIVPNVLRAAHLDEALAIAREMEHRSYDSFRLLVCDRRHVLECVWSEGEFRVEPLEQIERPRFYTSSGLGDTVVAAPRQKLFDECFAADNDWPAAQDAFHRHWWPENRGASVWMTRDQAMTVSRTEVDLFANEVRMTYHARVVDSAMLVSARPVSLSVADV